MSPAAAIRPREIQRAVGEEIPPPLTPTGLCPAARPGGDEEERSGERRGRGGARVPPVRRAGVTREETKDNN